MTLEAGWLKRQLDRVADDVEKWPDWMKREAEFSSGTAEVRGLQDDTEQPGNQTMKAGSD